ncbi:MAG: hypothetical protein RIR62_2093, partial [Pseudomonadota bacterium]
MTRGGNPARFALALTRGPTR